MADRKRSGRKTSVYSPGVHQVPEGCGEQRKLEETGCEVICGAQMTPTVKGQVKVKVMVKLLPYHSRFMPIG